MKIRRKTNYYMTVENVRLMGAGCAGYKWAGESKSGLPVYYSEAEWEEVPEKSETKLLSIRRKDGKSFTMRVVRSGSPRPDETWLAYDAEDGAKTYYSSEVWEEVPTEQWETIAPVLYQHGRAMRILYRGADNIGHCIDHTLPAGMRFVQDGDSVRIEGRAE